MNADGSDGTLVDIGHGVFIEVRRIRGTGAIEGIYYEHPGKDGETCFGWAPVTPNNPEGWDLVSVEPLTLSPSLKCRKCGHHGFIRKGRWVPA